MKPTKQRIVNSQYGDCFAACLASLLELPIEVIPNDHSDNGRIILDKWLEQFGLLLTYHNYMGPIWVDSPWIATVKSKNYAGSYHSIIMRLYFVLFDPSTKSVYKKGTDLLGKNIVMGGNIIRVSDFSLLHNLDDYRKQLNKEPQS